MSFGAITGIDVGTRFETMYEIRQTKLHVCNKWINFHKKGVTSIILRPIDRDDGENIVIVHKFSVASKAKNKLQEAFEWNRIHNCPVRLIRQHSKAGQYSPLVGYRYDGLYKVTNSIRLIEEEDVTHGVWHIYLELLHDQPIFWQKPPVRAVHEIDPAKEPKVVIDVGDI